MDRIQKTEGVCGGEPCIRNTRIRVQTILEYYNLKASDAEILKAFPSLTTEDLLTCRAYAKSESATSGGGNILGCFNGTG